jgi:hypothetical protein
MPALVCGDDVLDRLVVFCADEAVQDVGLLELVAGPQRSGWDPSKKAFDIGVGGHVVVRGRE